MGLIALVTDTGNANSTRLCLVQFHTLPVPVTRAINPPYCTLNRAINYTHHTTSCQFSHTPIVPPAPESLMKESVGISWIAISWQQTSTNIMQYIVMISGGGKQVNTTVDGSTTIVNVTELQPNTEYMLSVIAVAKSGIMSAPSIALIVETQEPQEPQGKH